MRQRGGGWHHAGVQQGVQEGQDQTGGGHHSPLHYYPGSSGSSALLVALEDNCLLGKENYLEWVSSSPSEKWHCFWKGSHVIILRLVKSLNITKLNSQCVGTWSALSFLRPILPHTNSFLRQFFPLPNSTYVHFTYICVSCENLFGS